MRLYDLRVTVERIEGPLGLPCSRCSPSYRRSSA